VSRRDAGQAGLVVGGIPRIDLLPPEVRARLRSRALRRGLGVLVVAVVVATAAGSALAVLNAATSAGALAAEQARTQTLLAQQVEFVEVTQLANAKAGIEQAQLVGSSTEILWPAYIDAINATLPAGSKIGTLTVTASSPITLVPQPALPLQVPRVATVQLTVDAPDLATVSAWISRLPDLPGFADATLTSIERLETGVKATVTINVTDAAFANRFVEAPEGTESDAETDEGES
jgi:hypothetical protein